MNDAETWSNAIGAAVIVNLLTLVGVLFLGLTSLKLVGDKAEETSTIASGFAGGVLLAAAIFLIFPESLHLIAEDYADEVRASRARASLPRRPFLECARGVVLTPRASSARRRPCAPPVQTEVNYRFGTMVLVGFSVVLFLDLAVSGVVKSAARRSAAKAPPDVETKPDQSEPAKPAAHDKSRILTAVLLGDAMHNFADGVFIASAFQLCSSTIGWVVVVGTIAHELPQEIADFILLTRVIDIKPMVALLLNFLSGMTIHLGVITVLALQVSPSATGMILAFGGGLYLYSAAAEAVPRMTKSGQPKLKLVALTCFVIGAVAIGLVLLGHAHCEGDHGDHGGHDDHGEDHHDDDHGDDHGDDHTGHDDH